MKAAGIIRSQSRAALKGNWVAAVAGVFTLLAFIFLGEFIYSLLILSSGAFDANDNLRHGAEPVLLAVLCLSFLLIFALTPIKNGVFRMFYNLSENKKCELSDVFYFFNRNLYFKTLAFNALTALKLALNILIGLSPYIICSVICELFSDVILTTVSANEILETVKIILLSLGFAAAAVLSLRLLVTEFLYGAQLSERPFTETRLTLKGHSADLFKLFISFILWILLCFFVLPIFYVIPYFLTSFATSTKWLFKLYKEGTRYDYNNRSYSL